ncbi:hypothetical protein ISF9_092 [Microbacterium phage vB_MoxS-ISF9]|uniref:Uncharacterized protein n=1 Tax=Microbacterium phage vB_MoxS-ISF9 TaxID=1458670 RepID=W8P0C7_9CAUD|nr:hypothetical protein ISF9_092 [Microbacterium phage vB_MoxS-ISF9]AHL18562.1 hypothetical protein ISF9_092 [Microbacterium phage vB_MoxS-ISF9]
MLKIKDRGEFVDFMPFVGISPGKAVYDISQKTGRPVRFEPHEEVGDVLA